MRNILQNLDWSVLGDMLFKALPALICITFHELSHGYVAYRLGDDTAKSMGRLTLNPIKHIDIMGLVSIMLFGFGWAKPVPVNMMNFKNPKRGMAITALAGPASNLVLAVVFLALYKLLARHLIISEIMFYVLRMILMTAYISIALAIFNLIPIPPLDGSKVLFSVISDSAYYKLMRYERYGSVVLVALLLTGVISKPLGAATQFVFQKLLF
ncbi:MAG: site-2 protease family protein [Oscillospiraceae bacterium]|nr:site-2 protease family protein [Oscillospiraceae bacterium]